MYREVVFARICNCHPRVIFLVWQILQALARGHAARRAVKVLRVMNFQVPDDAQGFPFDQAQALASNNTYSGAVCSPFLLSQMKLPIFSRAYPVCIHLRTPICDVLTTCRSTCRSPFMTPPHPQCNCLKKLYSWMTLNHTFSGRLPFFWSWLLPPSKPSRGESLSFRELSDSSVQVRDSVVYRCLGF